jgi:hypothetical protein
MQKIIDAEAGAPFSFVCLLNAAFYRRFLDQFGT